MAIIVTIEEIKALFPDASKYPDALITALIAASGKADDCLEADYDAGTAKLIKQYLVMHMLATGGGKRVKSQTAASGASQSFDFRKDGLGIMSTEYGRMIDMLDTNKCVENAYDTGSSFGVVGMGKRCL